MAVQIRYLSGLSSKISHVALTVGLQLLSVREGGVVWTRPPKAQPTLSLHAASSNIPRSLKRLFAHLLPSLVHQEPHKSRLLAGIRLFFRFSPKYPATPESHRRAS